jgi:hypothetical protein
MYKTIDFDSIEIMIDARSIVSRVLGGVAKEFEQRYGHVFYKLDRIYSPNFSQRDKDLLSEELRRMPPPNMPIWFRDFVTSYGSSNVLLQGREARVTWHAYVKGVVENWHTLVSELQHALDRVRLRTEARGREWEKYVDERTCSEAQRRLIAAGGHDTRKGQLPSSIADRTEITHPLRQLVPLERLYDSGVTLALCDVSRPLAVNDIPEYVPALHKEPKDENENEGGRP